MRKLFAGTILLVSLFGCNGESEAPSTYMIPNIDTSSSSAGIDADKNGVRDDIQAYIASKELPEAKEKALMGIAKQMHDTMLLEASNHTEVKASKDELIKQEVCFLYMNADPKVAENWFRKLSALTINTEARKLHAKKLNISYDGEVFVTPPAQTDCN